MLIDTHAHSFWIRTGEELGLNFLKQPFPAACRSAGQNFALFAARSISSAALATHHNQAAAPHPTDATLPSSPPGTATGSRATAAAPAPSSANRPRAKSAHHSSSSANKSRSSEGGTPVAIPTRDYRSPNLKIDTALLGGAAGGAEKGFDGSVRFLVRNLADKSPLRAPVAYAPIEVPANDISTENLRQVSDGSYKL